MWKLVSSSFSKSWASCKCQGKKSFCFIGDLLGFKNDLSTALSGILYGIYSLYHGIRKVSSRMFTVLKGQ